MPLGAPYLPERVKFLIDTTGYCEEWFYSCRSALIWMKAVAEYLGLEKVYMNIARLKDYYRVRVGWKRED